MRDHPRACGEHGLLVRYDEEHEGSSPRMRGTPRCCPRPSIRPRIIPAHAGNTFQSRAPRPSRRDHPRACGEHLTELTAGELETGSSPRMRGTRERELHAPQHVGIIPAHAGNTSTRFAAPRPRRDHPRACGEHAHHSSVSPAKEGSSPRMRGTRMRRIAERDCLGIIPAHAGNT